MTDHRWLADPAAVLEFARTAADAPWIALDLEANSMFVYREQVCLIQINAGGTLAVIDTLALPPGPEALAPLAPVLTDPARPVWLHGGEYDVGSMKRDYGIAMRGVFDTQQAAVLLGMERTGYGAVVEAVCSVALPKGHAQYDWATRPLDGEALSYAVDDVRWLPQVADELRRRVTAADLDEEVAIANGTVEESTWNGGYEPHGFWRLKGIRELPDGAMPTLASLWSWRDERGKAADLPPGRVINNEVLLRLAHTAPTNFGGLRRLGLKSWLVAEHGEALITLLKQAREAPGTIPPRPWHRETTPQERDRENRLKDWRRSEAEQRKVPLQVVLPARALEHLKQHGAGDLASVPQLGAKRGARYGEALRRICGG